MLVEVFLCILGRGAGRKREARCCMDHLDFQMIEVFVRVCVWRGEGVMRQRVDLSFPFLEACLPVW